MKLVAACRMSNSSAVARAAAAILFAAMLGNVAPAFSEEATTDRVIAIVNGTKIHESDLTLADEVIGRNLSNREPAERREMLINMLIDATMLGQAANERKIIDQADLQRRETFARNRGLMNHLLLTVGETAITDAALRDAYQELIVKASKEEPEIHLRHIYILVADPKDDAAYKEGEEKAKAALKRIKDKETFAAVASEVSDDPGSKPRGGDYGWRVAGELGKEIADAAFAMKDGEISPPIKSAAGWHVIEREEVRSRKPISFEKSRDQLAVIIAGKAQVDLVEAVRAAAKIERPEAATSVGKAPSK